MEEIFHEKQEGQLCGQHCLNALLQGPYYTAVDLATLAEQLDQEERRRMAEAGEQSDEYRRFINQPSSNMDDTGFFSVQVIANALNVWGLELVSYGSTSPVAVASRTDPTSQNAFICNYREHWFTIRRIGRQWFNLNSLLTGPELVSDTFLGMFLVQLETEGYTIYIVNGSIPESHADQVLRYVTVTQSRPPSLINEAAGSSGRAGAGRAASAAVARGATGGSASYAGQSSGGGDDEDAQMRAAMAMSLEGATQQASRVEDDDMKLAMQLSKSMMEQEEEEMAAVMQDAPPVDHTHDVSEEDQIQAAIAMSLSGGGKDEDKDLKRALAMSAAKDSSLAKPASSKPATSTATSASMSKASSATAAAAQKPSQTQAKASTSSFTDSKSSSASKKSQEVPSPTAHTSPTNKPAIPAAPKTVPGPATLPGQGQRLSGAMAGTSAAARGSVGATPGARQATPDPEEVRRARLKFLEKKK